MSGYKEVATVTSIPDLKNVITNYHLQSGDRLRLKMDVISPFGYLFNLTGAELAFNPLMPDHINLIDVWGEGDSGYIEMEATSPWLGPVLAFMGEHWMGVVVAGVVIALIIVAISISIKIAQADANLTTGLVIAGAVALGVVYIATRKKEKQ